jgi:hypothetical protein
VTTTSSLPVDGVKQLDALAVAGWLGLEPSGRERDKYACRWCESSDGLHIYPGPGKSVHCFVCAKTYSTVDLVMQVRGLGFVEAVKWLADRAGLLILDGPTFPAGGKISPAARSSLRKQEDPPQVSEPDPVAVSVFTCAIEHLTMTEHGLAALAARGLGYPETAREVGFRSLDGIDDLRALYRALSPAFPREILGRFIRPASWLPFKNAAPVLVIAYRHNGEVKTFRFRNLLANPEKNQRYRDLQAHAPKLPWHADALTNLGNLDLHVCEGELNAFALWGVDSTLRVIGLPGAGRIPGGQHAAWLRQVGQARRLLCWFDPDRAGDEGAAGFATAVAGANDWTADETRARIKRVRPDVAGDLNELLQRGQLHRIVAELGRV